jgi:hypothetical protein
MPFVIYQFVSLFYACIRKPAVEEPCASRGDKALFPEADKEDNCILSNPRGAIHARARRLQR